MGKNLSIKELKRIQESNATYDSISVNIDNEKYDVRIETSFRYSKLDEIFKWVGDNEKILSIIDDEQVLSVLIILKFMTDIEMGESIDEALEAVARLTELGILADIINAVPTKTLERYIQGLLDMTKQIEKGMKNYKNLKR
jgi:hypothetical protein